jgi:hypothetical protein
MTEFADEEGRWEPPIAGDEGATLLGFLECQCATVAWKTVDLDTAGLRATHGLSAMTLGGRRFHRGTPWTGARFLVARPPGARYSHHRFRFADTSYRKRVLIRLRLRS